jgi:DivIVA domain-containing protein
VPRPPRGLGGRAEEDYAPGMTSRQSHEQSQVKPFEVGMSTMRPEDVTNHDLPIAMRGYDRERVDRLLARLAEAYRLTWKQSEALRERLRSLETELAAAEADARASAKSVAELMQRSPAAKDQPPQTREARDVLEVRLERSERAREQAVADLRQMSERASALGQRVEVLEDEFTRPQPPSEVAQPAVTDAEAARLLVAATRAAEDVRDAARARALRTLTKARELSALVHAQTERENVALAEILERREQVQREADEILAAARAEADRLVAAIGEERHRVRDLLAGALASLDAEGAASSEGLIADLEFRLHGTTEPTAT